MTIQRFSCGPLDVPDGDKLHPVLWDYADMEVYRLVNAADEPTYDPASGKERIFYAAFCKKCGWRVTPDCWVPNTLADAINGMQAHVVRDHRDAREAMGLKVVTTNQAAAESLAAELVDEDPTGQGRRAWVVSVG